MTVLRLVFAAAVVFAAIAGGVERAGAENGYWEPPGIHPSTASLEAVRAKIVSSEGALSQGRIERYDVTANGIDFAAVATILGDDFIVRSTLDGATYAAGRSGGAHWRRTSAGLVHLVESDVQGDDLDRWPTARLALASTCTLAGETSGARGAQWVVLDRRPHDIPHWFYVDEASGAIVREITHEGTRVETTTFDDVRPVGDATVPNHWRVEGPGGTLEVTVRSIELASVPPADVAIPASIATLALPRVAQLLPSRFHNGAIFVTVGLDGRKHSFSLDTGTPQIVITSGLARRLAAHVALEHTRLRDLSIGTERAANVPVFSVDFGWDEGILGFDFFAGRIVHIDYANARVEEIPRGGFAAPPDAFALDTNFDEGMPIVAARVGNLVGERFVLDTGSPHIVILANLLRRKHARQSDLRVSVGAKTTSKHYLEGSIETEAVRFNAFQLGDREFEVGGELQTYTRNDDAEFPIDGIIGTDLLKHYEWWFDATGDRAWYRWQG